MEKTTIYTYSVLFSSTEEFKDKTPYISAILEKENGERFASLVEGYTDGIAISVGQEVKSATNAEGNTIYSL